MIEYKKSDGIIAWEIDFGAGMEGDTKIDCDNCGQTFHCERHCEITYSTKQ